MTLLYTIKTYNKSLVENIIANLDATILASYADGSCDTCDSEHSYTSVKIVLQAKVTDDKKAYDELFNSWSKETVYE